MTVYKRTPSETFSSFTVSQDVAARRAARKKVIEKAHRIERESYKAMMQRRRVLQGATSLDTIT